MNPFWDVDLARFETLSEFVQGFYHEGTLELVYRDLMNTFTNMPSVERLLGICCVAGLRGNEAEDRKPGPILLLIADVGAFENAGRTTDNKLPLAASAFSGTLSQMLQDFKDLFHDEPELLNCLEVYTPFFAKGNTGDLDPRYKSTTRSLSEQSIIKALELKSPTSVRVMLSESGIPPRVNEWLNAAQANIRQRGTALHKCLCGKKYIMKRAQWTEWWCTPC